MTFSAGESARYNQLDALSAFEAGGNPLLVHGSVGHAALMGTNLPSERRFNGTERDVDIYMPNQSKSYLEIITGSSGLASPQPLDAGLCGLLIREGSRIYAQKDGVVVELESPDIFKEVTQYELRGTDGIQVRSFTPAGVLATHTLEPMIVRPTHIRMDWELAHWFERNCVVLPPKLKASIDEFHKAYRAMYPMGTFYRQLADIYVSLLPENIRFKFRKQTHRFMRDHAGRSTPFAD